jgi:L-ascorbate metabolism protein UlaG (beta-lactamase superfamily)
MVDLLIPSTHRAAFPAGSLTVRVVGGPTAVLELGGLRLLTDPTRPVGTHESAPGRPLTKTEGPAVALDAIGAVDAVLLSHDQHADNLDPAGRDFLPSPPLTLTTEAAAQRLGGTARAHQLGHRRSRSTRGRHCGNHCRASPSRSGRL